MGTKVTVDEVENILNSSGVATVNENDQKLADEFDKVLYADGSIPVTGDIDMDSNRILNLPLPLTTAEPITRGQIDVVINQVIADVQDELDDEVAAAQAARADAVAAADAAAADAASASDDADAAAADAASANADATTATTQAGIATTQAGIATTQAGNASTSASTASTAATTATTQAGIATTQAGNAASSASAASTSASNAATAEAAAVAAAASLYVTSYSHKFSAGDRTTIGVANGGSFTTQLTVSTGTINNLIDGGTTNNDTDGVNFGVGQAVTGLNIFQWILPEGEWVLCDEFVIKNSGTQSYGTGILYGLNAAGNWVAVSADAANGGATTVTRAATATDKSGYNGFRLVGTSGSTAAGRMLEVEFKLADGSIKGLSTNPTNTTKDLVLTQNSSGVSGDYVWKKPVDYNGALITSAGPLGEYFFNEGTGEIVYDQSGNGNHINFGTTHRATYGGVLGTNYVWNKQGLLLRKAMVQTPSLTNTKTVVALYIPMREDGSTVQWNVSSNTAIGSNHVHMGSDGHTQSTQTVHIGNGGEGVRPLWRDSNGNNGFILTAGGPTLVFSESSSAITGMLGIGGQANVAADTLKSTKMVCVYFAVYSGSLTDTDRTNIRDALRKAMAVRDVYLDWRDCPTFNAGAFNIGQSNVGNESISVNDLSGTNTTNLSYTPNTIILSAGRRSDAAPMSLPTTYRNGFNSFPGFRSVGMGFEAGMALAHEKANATIRRKLVIIKVAPGSSNVASSSNGALDWQGTAGGSLTGWALKQWAKAEQYFLERGEGLRLYAVNTQNGEQEANTTGVANGWPALYQAGMQWVWNKIKEQLLFNGMKIQVGELFPYETGQSNYTQVDIDAVRAAQAAFVAANSSEASLITSAAGLKQTDKVHITADNSVVRGEVQFYPGMALT